MNQNRWKTSQQCLHNQLSTQLSHWLFDTQSLTQRIKQHCNQQFEVKIIQQGWQKPQLDEANQLGLAPHQYALVREVYLLCHQQPFVYARSIIPQKTLKTNRACLGKLGTRPLGEILFSSPSVKRGKIYVSHFEENHTLYKKMAITKNNFSATNPSFWGRRSLFFLQSNPMLVSEIFIAPEFNRI
jgi:chorismate lyase